MVYHGPSGGCNSCRRRRKKCDQTRPSCMKCIKANRACGGYELEAPSTFRRYEAQDASRSSSFSTMARKCGLPKRVPIPGTNILPEDTAPLETSEDESNMYGLRCFVYDYCAISANRNLSRGYLSGVEIMARRLGPKSDLAKACQAIVFASHGKPMNRPRFVRKADRFYQELLVSLARALESPPLRDVEELKVIAMLLGLYQMDMADEHDPGNHDTHAKGLSALLKVGHLPLNPLITVKSCPTKMLLPSKYSSIFSVPALGGPGEGLEHILFQLHLLWMEFEVDSSSKDLDMLRSQAFALEHRCVKWEETRTSLLMPTAIGHMNPSLYGAKVGAGAWPGKVDTYFDLYVAGVWNIFRSARLLLLHLIFTLSDTLADSGGCIGSIHTANRIAEDMAASVPYHLADNLQAFLNEHEVSGGMGITDPGRFLAGLLLMHPLYVASRIPFLDERIREYFKTCLGWIGENMGVGQATLLAKAEHIDREYLASGCMIIWSGFLM